MKHWRVICLTILFLQLNLKFQHVRSQLKECPASEQTVKVVDTCPTTEADVKEAAKLKNCSFFAERQTCTYESKFKYHCVINVFVNATISVCAPERHIKGYCTEYNIKGQRIQDHYKLPCTNHSPSCPALYPSTDAYKYPSCYEIVYAKRTKVTTPVLQDDDSEALSPGVIGGVVASILVVICGVVAGGILFIFFRRRKGKRQKSSIPTAQESMHLVTNDDVAETENEEAKGQESRVVTVPESVSLAPDDDIAETENSEAEGRPKNEEHHEPSSEDDQQQNDVKPIDFKQLEEEGRNPTGMPISEDTATDTSLLVMQKDEETLAEENLEDTKKYLRNYKIFDKYYEETGMYKNAKQLIEKNGVVIIIGPPGCGKTNAAVHLMRMYAQKKENWDIRKISAHKDFSFVKFSEKKSTLFFIDNLSFENSFFYEIEEWWKKLDYIYNYIKRFKGTNGMHKEGKVQLLITARSNVIEKAGKSMKWTPPVFKEDFIIDVAISPALSETERKTICITDEEKERIFKRQLDFAKQQLHLDFQSCDEKFMKEIKLAKGPIGFPLCAHLYACKKEYRKRGSRFFTHPIDILRMQIEKEIESDSSNRTRTVFFLLFLYEWHLKTKDSHERLNIGNSESCKTFLRKISKDVLDQFSILNFNQLETTGKRLAGAFLREMEVGRSIFRFTHDSVFDAVGTYFCDKYFKQTVQWFPLEVLLNQESLSLSEEKCSILTLRLLYEAFNQKLAQIFSCSAFRQESFADAFMKELSKRKQNMIAMFFNLKDDTSFAGLPVTFWSSKNNLYYLTDKMLNMINAKTLGYEYHLFMSFLGECASRAENLLTQIKSKMKEDMDELKNMVGRFNDDNGDSLLHIIIESPRRDEDACELIKTLFKTKGVNINHRNRKNITPVMKAVRCTIKRTKLIEELVKAKAYMKYKDVDGSTVFHHCLSSENDDQICSETITLLLESKTLKKINTDDNKGETPLNIAAKQHRYSRILSILALLKSDEITIDTSNLDGCSPIQNTLLNLHGDDAISVLERCARLAIFVVFGVNPEHQADETEYSNEWVEYENDDTGVGTEGKEGKLRDKGKKAIDMCKELELEYEETILSCSKDQDKMASVLETILHAVNNKQTSDEEYEVKNPGNKLSKRLLGKIKEAVKILAKKKLDLTS